MTPLARLISSSAVSLVQGFNLPLEITNTAGCPVASCPVDLGPNCQYPFHLHTCTKRRSTLPLNFVQVPMHSRVRSTLLDTLWGARVTVKSIPTRPTHRAVAQALTALRTPARILQSFIIHTSVRPSGSPVKACRVTPCPESNCPDAYAYAYDESSGTALWTCPTSSNADYTITFCP